MKPATEPVFDMGEWLGSSRLLYRAQRMGIQRYVPLSHLKASLGRLLRDCMVSETDVRELLEDLRKENLLE